MKPPFFKRVKRAVKQEFRRIRDEHRSTGSKRRRPPWPVRLRHWYRKQKEKGFGLRRKRPSRSHGPPLSARLKYFYNLKREKYSVVFSRRYLVIALNSTVLFLVSFFLVHFLTHLVTGVAARFCGISTTLNYTFVDFHIRYWNWTDEMVITVFSIPAIFAAILAILASLPFVKHMRMSDVVRWVKGLRYITKKQRYKRKRIHRRGELELQVQRLNKTAPPVEKPKRKKRLSWRIKLFLLWTLYHSTGYFFSGMLYSFLFHRRFGYVIWYAFNAYPFDLLFSFAAFLSLVIIGYFFSAQFLYSGRMYFNNLTSSNRMPFAISQAIFPFIIGTMVTMILQIPVFDPSLILLNFSIFFLLLPLPSRAVRFESLHFDSREKKPVIYWRWLAWSAIIIVSIIIALKIGISISQPAQ
jgi:MFS family permease